MPAAAPALPPTLISPALVRPENAAELAAPERIAVIEAETRRWCQFAVGSLVVAGLLSLAVVLGRLPGLSRLIDDPLFFKRCLVVHVDMALVVWFYAFLAGLLSLHAPGGTSPARTAAFAVSVGGVVAMLAGALMRGAEPILSNYVPMIDHPLFAAGLGAFFAGILGNFVHALVARQTPGREISRIASLPRGAVAGFQAAAILVALAGATWVSAWAGLPSGLDPATRAEFLSWGAGHVLQAANTAAMLAVWLWLLARATGVPALSTRAAWAAFAALVVPQCAMPLLTARGTMDPLYHSGATHLMRWAIFPVVLVVLAAGARHLWRHRARVPADDGGRRLAIAGFVASGALTLLGLALGAAIRGSTTLVPAHYHASLGAVTAAFMTAAYLVGEAVSRGDGGCGLGAGVWRRARRQISLFGAGQAVFALGFALCGVYGLGRKAYAAEQHVRGAGEVAGLVIMGAGGLVAVAGGIWFLGLILREMRGWWQRRGNPSRKQQAVATS